MWLFFGFHFQTNANSGTSIPRARSLGTISELKHMHGINGIHVLLGLNETQFIQNKRNCFLLRKFLGWYCVILGVDIFFCARNGMRIACVVTKECATR